MMKKSSTKPVGEIKNARMNGGGVDLSAIDTSLPGEKTSLATKMSKKKPKKKMSMRKKIIIAVVAVLAAAGGVVLAMFLLDNHQPEEAKKEKKEKKYYSVLTGEEIADEKLNKSPTYCMQIPNGADGARPQVGLTKAGVVFEAIAEAGITRFAAVFQNTDLGAIGPIRSLRLYYLDWDVPFDCTIVHAGGSGEAIDAVAAYKDLTESNEYMKRISNGYVAPNNLFTSSEMLEDFAKAKGYETTDDMEAFPRLKPGAAKRIAKKNLRSAEEDSSKDDETENSAATKRDGNNATKKSMHKRSHSGKDTNRVTLAEQININFGSNAAFNTVYKYDKESNSYLRSYGDGSEHISYECNGREKVTAPKKDCGEPKQVAPKAVAVMMVDQWLDTDRYHLRTQTIGTGTAYVFQNGEVLKGTWSKAARDDQIIFKDENEKEIKFTPGQLWIAALPNSTGRVQY